MEMNSLNNAPSFTPMYASRNSFGHLKLEPESTDYNGTNIVLMGVPFDASASNRTGSRFAPRAIREASCMIWTEMPFDWKQPIPKNLITRDIGDLVLDYGKPDMIYEQIENGIKNWIKGGAKTLAIGGAHSISYPFLREYAKKFNRPISLLQFDAHTDTWDDAGIKRIDHGSTFYHAIKNEYIDPEHSVQLGIRTVNSKTMGVNIFDNNYIHTSGIENTIQQVKNIIRDNPVYISFDIDFLDPAFAPATGTPVCGGFSTWQAQRMLEMLAGLNICGMDLVEVSPPYDNAEITSLAAAHLLTYALKLLAVKTAG